MRTRRIVELERHELASGGEARVTRLGRTYNYSRSFPDGRPPEVVVAITKDEAYRLLAEGPPWAARDLAADHRPLGEEALRRDVMELD